jgi:hypothetical protein
MCVQIAIRDLGFRRESTTRFLAFANPWWYPATYLNHLPTCFSTEGDQSTLLTMAIASIANGYMPLARNALQLRPTHSKVPISSM